jgi:hypothetical protein
MDKSNPSAVVVSAIVDFLGVAPYGEKFQAVDVILPEFQRKPGPKKGHDANWLA